MVHVDVDLRALQSAIVLFDVLFVDVFFDDRRHHECAIENLSESQLLGKVHHAAEQRGHRDFAIDEQFESLEYHAAEMQFDFFALQNRLQRLNRRVVASGLVADA